MKPLRIGIDVSRTALELSGIGHYVRNLVESLSRVNDERHSFVLYGAFFECAPDRWKNAYVPKNKGFKLHQRHLRGAMIRDRWRHLKAPPDKLIGDVDVIHSTAFVMPPVETVPSVVHIHDLSCIVHPEYHDFTNIDLVVRNILKAARQASLILTLSEKSKSDILRYLHVEEDLVRVVGAAASSRFFKKVTVEDRSRIRKHYNINNPYFLFVSSLEPRKNPIRLLQAYRLFLESVGEDIDLVFAGPKGWKNEDVHRTIHSLGLNANVKFIGYVTEEDLPALYQEALAFVYPSLYEGFGMPILEAMGSGTPVITSRIPPLTEVAGGAALLADPLNVHELAEAMCAMAESGRLREALIEKGRRRASQFNWDDIARRTLSAYEEAAERWPSGGDRH
ncbi:MAG: glycosyltransferase family 1 protein [Acidobacteriota bacterium]|jgi:glycosyltransferase involved in cell wall biosynthesis